MSTINKNPLLETQERLAQAEPASAHYGTAARGHQRLLKRQHTERIALTALEKYLPRLFHSPPYTGQFELLWQHFIEGLGLACDNEVRYRDALNVILKLLHLGNTRQCWSLPLPTLALEVKRTPQRQTESWFHHSRSALQAYHQWLQQINTGLNRDSNQLLADILHSAAMHSGLNSAAGLYQLAHAVNRRDQLWHNGQQVWLALNSDDPKRPTNASSADGLTSEWRFFPALPTLGLLYRWYRGSHLCPLPVHSSAVDLWLRPYLASPLNSLNELARYGSIVAECLPGVAWPQILVGVANGTLLSASLPHSSWRALHQINLPSPATLCTVPLVAVTDVSNEPRLSSRTGQALAHSPFLQQLRDALVERSNVTTKNTKASSLEALRAIDISPLCLPEQILHGWFCHALSHRNNKPSTLRTYLSNGGIQWLTRCHGHDIGHWSAETWLAHYHSLLEEYRNPVINTAPLDETLHDASVDLAIPPDSQPRDARSPHASYVADRLTQLHQYGVQHFGLAPLPERLADGVRQRPHVRAGFISEPLFNTLLQALAAHPGLNDTFREKLILITLIAGRAGLRISELIKLRVQDIDDHRDSWLRIRNTPLDDGKTDSARRNIPLGCLLSPTEAQRVQHYVHHMHSRRGKVSQALLFPSEAGWQIPLSQQEITTPIIALLRASCGQPLVFHHLRHSALCKLQLALHHNELNLHAHPDGLWRNLLPWDKARCQQIVQTVTGDHAPSHYWALAQFAGHQGPGTTLQSYLHCCDWVTAACLQQARFDWSAAERRYLTGLSDAQLRANGLDKGSLTYARCWPLLQHKLRRYLRLQVIIQSEVAPLPPPAKRKVDFFVLLEALRLVEQGKNVQGLLAGYGMPAGQLTEWIAKAKALGQLQTRRKCSRLLAGHRKRALLPGEQRSHSEQQELPILVKKARTLYRTKRTELTAWLRYLLHHTTTSKHGIAFQDPAELLAFVSTTLQLLPANRLALSLYCKAADQTSWTQGLSLGICIDCNPLNPISRQRNRAILRIRHPDEQAIVTKHQTRPNPTYNHYSTPVLCLLGYVICLQLFTLEEISQWS